MRGIIADIEYQQGSGLCIVVFKQGAHVPCDAGPTFRSFDAAFGSVADAVGKTIDYEMTEFGTMAGFSL